ncbi:MAG: hypothetical protein Kow0089_07290 [Desulfobulbaceae bacterium]
MEYRRDPVCGMQVAVTDATPRYRHDGQEYYFCSTHCMRSFRSAGGGAAEDVSLGVRESGPGVPPILAGCIGMSALFAVFFTVVTLANGSIGSALQEFSRLWYWVILLAAGFGFQLGLFFHIRQTVRKNISGATTEVAASGTISTGSMIACCAHGLVNLLPIVGLSAAAAFLAKYQLPFILLGVFSNLFGMTIMLDIAARHEALPENSFGKWIRSLNLKAVRYATLLVGLGVVLGSAYRTYGG